jgi:hypothetical protein
MTLRERFAAWIVTGPVGHFAALADFTVIFWRLATQRFRAVP